MLDLRNVNEVWVTINSEDVKISRSSLDIHDDVEKVDVIRSVTNWLKAHDYQNIVYEALLTYQHVLSDNNTILHLMPAITLG